MSVTHTAYPRISPFWTVDEQVFVMPQGGTIVHNRTRKLLFFFEAGGRHFLEGRQDTSSVLLAAGDILVVPHICIQHYQPTSPGLTRVHALRLLLDPELLPAFPAGFSAAPADVPWEEQGDDATRFAARHCSEHLHLPGGMTSEVRETLARLRREADAGSDAAARPHLGHDLRVGAACLDLLVLVARQVARHRDVSGTVRLGHGAFRTEEVRDFIMRRMDQPLDLNSIAAHLQLSPEHLARQWKKHTGTTLFGFLRRARVDRAKTLLTATDQNISQIGQACGFSSLALFSRTFKQETGYAPGQYRERLVTQGGSPVTGGYGGNG